MPQQSQQSPRIQQLAPLVLALAFAVAGLVFAGAGFRAWSEEGFSQPTIVAALAVLGTLSLTRRYVQVARVRSRECATYRSERR